MLLLTNQLIFLSPDAEIPVLFVVFVCGEMKNQTKPYFLSCEKIVKKCKWYGTAYFAALGVNLGGRARIEEKIVRKVVGAILGAWYCRV